MNALVFSYKSNSKGSYNGFYVMKLYDKFSFFYHKLLASLNFNPIKVKIVKPICNHKTLVLHLSEFMLSTFVFRSTQTINCSLIN